MVVGVLQVELLLHGTQSLKQKRGVIRRLLSRCRNRFPVSAAEVDNQDLWQRATLGFAIAGSSEPVVAPILQRLDEEIESCADVEIISSELEYIHL